MTTRDRLRAIAARGIADADDLDVVWQALAATGKAEQRAAAETLAALALAGQEVRALIDRALADAAPRRRWGATYACALLGPLPASCLPILQDALGDADGDLRWASAAILRAQVALPGLQAVLHGLLTSRGWTKQEYAAWIARSIEATLFIAMP